jgi:hypothetical protein
MKQGGNVFALNSLNKMTDTTINSMSSAKNVYSSEAVDKYLTDVLGDIKNAAGICLPLDQITHFFLMLNVYS